MKRQKILCLFAGISMLSLCACSYSRFEDNLRAQTEKTDNTDADDQYNDTDSDAEETDIEKSGAKIAQKDETISQIDVYGQQINYTLKNVTIKKTLSDLHLNTDTANQEITQNLQKNKQKDTLFLKAEFEVENVNYLGILSEHTDAADKYLYYIQDQVFSSNSAQEDADSSCSCIYFNEHGADEKNYFEFYLPEGQKKKIILVWTLPPKMEHQNLYFDVAGSVGVEKNYIQLQ